MLMKIRNFTKILNSVFLVSLQLHFLVYHKIADTHTAKWTTVWNLWTHPSQSGPTSCHYRNSLNKKKKKNRHKI